jgi:hypothetical protein
MLLHATDWHRGSNVGAGRLRSVGGIRPAQTEMIHVRVDLRESMQKTGRGWIGAGGYKGGSRGAVLVHGTCGCDILAGIVVRRHPEAICSHPPLLASVGLWAHKSEQCGYQRGGECLHSCWQPCLGPTSNSPGQSRRPYDLAALSRALLPLPMTPGNYGVLLQKAVGGGMFEGVSQSIVSL